MLFNLHYYNTVHKKKYFTKHLRFDSCQLSVFFPKKNKRSGEVFLFVFFYEFQRYFCNPFPNKPWFLRVCSTSLLKTQWEKEEIAHNEQFLLFAVFSTLLDNFPPFLSILKLSSAKSLSLEESKIYRLGKSLSLEQSKIYRLGKSLSLEQSKIYRLGKG